jgi:DNA recombination-dependent growth factor C|tara:strand:+ start:145 stop:321 length:177 start_codon:yes stop_codon:yes gene_type:complete
MPDHGVRPTDLTSLASAEDLLAQYGGTLGMLPVPALSTRLAASGAVADRLAELDRAPF